jgi:hypothetical protein
MILLKSCCCLYNYFFLLKTKIEFLNLLQETEYWIYSEEAENQEKDVYIDKLVNLKVRIKVV